MEIGENFKTVRHNFVCYSIPLVVIQKGQMEVVAAIWPNFDLWWEKIEVKLLSAFPRIIPIAQSYHNEI